jgi:hypothetical protein
MNKMVRKRCCPFVLSAPLIWWGGVAEKKEDSTTYVYRSTFLPSFDRNDGQKYLNILK